MTRLDIRYKLNELRLYELSLQLDTGAGITQLSNPETIISREQMVALIVQAIKAVHGKLEVRVDVRGRWVTLSPRTVEQLQQGKLQFEDLLM